MADRRIIAVVGATGAQGGGLVRAILDDRGGGFAARAITRNVGSGKARELARRGAEVVAADADDEASLTRALRGCHGAFFVTFFWDHLSPEKEKAQALNMARAAKAAGVQHAIWSTLEDTRRWVPLSDDRMPTLMGRYKVPHCDAKGEADVFFTELGVPTTFLLTSFYWDNFVHLGLGPKRGPDGKLALTFPMGDKRLPGVAAEDIGRCAYGIFKRGRELIGKTIGVAGEHPTVEEMAAALTDALGQEVRYNAVTPEAYRGLDFVGAAEMGNMFQFKCDFHEQFCGARDPGVARALNPALQSFRAWLDQHKKQIPLD